MEKNILLLESNTAANKSTCRIWALQCNISYVRLVLKKVDYKAFSGRFCSNKKAIVFLLSTFLLFIVSGCSTGYVKENGDWVWVTRDESHGKRSHYIEGIDQESFHVLKNKNFAMDNARVYFKGKIVWQAKPDGFTPLTDDEYGYAKNKEFVFLNNEVILNADPATFEIISFPYSRDKKDVYCGTIPMMLAQEDVNSFIVTNSDDFMTKTITTTSVTHFIEYHPEYKWIETQYPANRNVILGESGTGEAGRKKYMGLTQIK